MKTHQLITLFLAFNTMQCALLEVISNVTQNEWTPDGVTTSFSSLVLGGQPGDTLFLTAPNFNLTFSIMAVYDEYSISVCEDKLNLTRARKHACTCGLWFSQCAPREKLAAYYDKEVVSTDCLSIFTQDVYCKQEIITDSNSARVCKLASEPTLSAYITMKTESASGVNYADVYLSFSEFMSVSIGANRFQPTISQSTRDLEDLLIMNSTGNYLGRSDEINIPGEASPSKHYDAYVKGKEVITGGSAFKCEIKSCQYDVFKCNTINRIPARLRKIDNMLMKKTAPKFVAAGLQEIDIEALVSDWSSADKVAKRCGNVIVNKCYHLHLVAYDDLNPTVAICQDLNANIRILEDETCPKVTKNHYLASDGHFYQLTSEGTYRGEKTDTNWLMSFSPSKILFSVKFPKILQSVLPFTAYMGCNLTVEETPDSICYVFALNDTGRLGYGEFAVVRVSMDGDFFYKQEMSDCIKKVDYSLAVISASFGVCNARWQNVHSINVTEADVKILEGGIEGIKLADKLNIGGLNLSLDAWKTGYLVVEYVLWFSTFATVTWLIWFVVKKYRKNRLLDYSEDHEKNVELELTEEIAPSKESYLSKLRKLTNRK